MAKGCRGRSKKAESKKLEGDGWGWKNWERLGWEGENPQRVVVPVDDYDDDDQGRPKSVLSRAEQVLCTSRWPLRCSVQGLVYTYMAGRCKWRPPRRSVNIGRWSQSNTRSPVSPAIHSTWHPSPCNTDVIHRKSNTNVFVSINHQFACCHVLHVVSFP